MKTIHINEPTIITRRPRVAAYCRVSTEKEEEKSSLEAQIAHFTSCINSNLDWEFAGIYAEQKLGTRDSVAIRLMRLSFSTNSLHRELRFNLRLNN